MSKKNKCVEQPRPHGAGAGSGNAFGSGSVSAPDFWNGLSLAFVAGLRVAEVERKDDGVWCVNVAHAGYVHLADNDEDFRVLVKKAVEWKRANERRCAVCGTSIPYNWEWEHCTRTCRDSAEGSR